MSYGSDEDRWETLSTKPMSEYQFFHFLAIDRPLNDEQLEFMQQQSTRTVAELYAAAAKLRLRSEELAREAAARRRAERLVQLAADPKKAVEHAAKLVAQRSTMDYELAAAELADLRDAMNSAAGDKLVTKAVASLIEKYPTLNNLKSSLRKRGLMPPR